MSDETEADVTFVGGHAVEQHDAPDVPADRAEELEAAKKAVREAIEKAGKDGAEDGKRLSKKSDPYSAKEDNSDETEGRQEPTRAKEEGDEEEAKLSRILKNREKLAKAKAAQNVELQKQQAQMQQAYRQLQAEKQAVEAERAKLARLKSDPAAAIRDAGWDPEEFILSLAKEGTEEGKVARLLREQQEQLKQMNQWREEQLRQREEYARRTQQQQAVQHRQSVEQQFLGHALNEEARPHTAAFYKGREGTLVAEGDLVAAQYRELTGQEASLEDIAEYIEEQLAQRATAWYEKSAGGKRPQPQQAAAPKPGKPAKTSGKTLTSGGSSERRALGKSLADLDGEERLQAAREAVKLAIANAPRGE